MASIQPDEPIPGEEELYRAIHITHVDGDRVVGAGIHLPQHCVVRAKYGAPDVPLIATRPQDNGIAVTTPADLPASARCAASDVEWSWDARHTPQEGPAHAEVQLLRASDRQLMKPKSPAVKHELKERLAARFRVHTRPTAA